MSKRYPKGCDLSRIPKATDAPPTDVKTLSGVDSSNPFLRALRIQQGFLKPEDLPVELRDGKVPHPQHPKKEENK
jgi:hypothetical protein